MSDDKVILVCVRAEPGVFRVPGSVQESCDRCLAPVWVSPASRKAAEQHGLAIAPRCMPCVEVTEGIEQALKKMQPMTEEQAREIMPNLNTEN